MDKMEPEEFLMRGYEKTIHNLRTKITRLKGLVRELVRIINGLMGLRELSIPYYEKEAEYLLDRPEVREIMGGE